MVESWTQVSHDYTMQNYDQVDNYDHLAQHSSVLELPLIDHPEAWKEHPSRRTGSADYHALPDPLEIRQEENCITRPPRD